MTVNPAFASVFIPSTPIDIPRVILPASSSLKATADPFIRVPEGTSRSAPLLVLPNMPAQLDLEDLNLKFESARRERKSGNFETAASLYRDILVALEAPFDQSPNPSPLYCHMPRGGALFAEAVFELAALSHQKDAAGNISRLSRFIANPPADANTDFDLAKAWLLKGYSLMRHADAANGPQYALYSKAIAFVDHAISQVGRLDDHAQADDFNFYARLLKLELLIKQLVLCHGRRDIKARGDLIVRIRNEFNNYNAAELDEQKLAILANYHADVAVLKARLGLWGVALERARTVTSGLLGSTPAAKKVLAEELFSPFVDGERILTPSEIKLRSRSYGWMRRLQAAFAMAHSEGLKYSVGAGAMGMAAGVAVDTMLSGGHAVFFGAAGAALASAIYRLKNGWETDEALYAGEIGTYDRRISESAADVARFLVFSGMEGLIWAAPATVMSRGMQGLEVFYKTLAHAAELYLQFGRWALTGAVSLADPDTYSKLSSALPDPHLGTILYNLYTKAAGLLFASNLLVPSLRSSTDRIAWMFLPGAIMLSADMGMFIKGQSPIDLTPDIFSPAFLDRIERISIVEAEIFLMMLVSGIISLKDRRTFSSTVRSLFSSLRPSNANYMLPLAAAITNGISSPLGDMMQKEKCADYVTIAVQGAATTIGLLPITLGISGVFKGKIPILDGIREGWQDSRGSHFPARLRSAVAGGIDAFNMPYARNRIGRSVLMDIVPAGLRTANGWDSNLGQFSMSSFNFVAGNGAATSTWPEPSGTRWERDSLAKATKKAASTLALLETRLISGELTQDAADILKDEAFSELRDFFLKAGQVTHVLHPILRHRRLRDRFWPLHSVTRPFAPPEFPHVPNRYLYGNIHQMLTGGYPEVLDTDQVAALLEYIRMEAQKPNAYQTLRPLALSVALARNSAQFGASISTFFEENAWILDLLDIDMRDLEPPADMPRRKARRIVRNAVKMPFGEYERAVADHGRSRAHTSLLEGIFVAPKI